MDPEAFRREAHGSPTGSPTTSTIPDAIRSSRRFDRATIRDALPARAPEQRRVVRRDLRRLRAHHPSRHHALEPSRLLRLLRDHRQRARHPRASSSRRRSTSQAMLWRTSPAATELEEVALGWLRQLLGLPDAFEGVIYDTASISTLHALAAAREAAVAGVRARGLAGRADIRGAARLLLRARALVGRQGGDPARPRPRRAATDSGRRASSACGPTRSRDAIARRSRARACCRSPSSPRSARRRPPASIRSPRSRRSVVRERVWLHVDAAYAGVAAMVPGYEWILRGAEHADSLVVNPHKWLFTPFDLSVLYCRRMDVLRAGVLADARVPRDERRARPVSEPDGHRHPARTPLPRAEALDGAAALRRGGPARAPRGAHAARARCSRRGSMRAIGSSASRRCPSASSASACGTTRTDERHARILDRVNASGEVFLSHTKLDGRYVLRLAIGNLQHNRTAHVARAWELLNSRLPTSALS